MKIARAIQRLLLVWFWNVVIAFMALTAMAGFIRYIFWMYFEAVPKW